MILKKKNRVDSKDRRLISNLYLNQKIREKLGKIYQRKGRGVRQGSIAFNIYLEDVMRNCIDEPNGVIIGGRRIKSQDLHMTWSY